MAQRFELHRVFSISPSRGVERIVRSLFVSQEPRVAGAVVVSLPLSVERGAANRTPETSP
jgi:hypothetical protein